MVFELSVWSYFVNCDLLCVETVIFHRGQTVRLPCNTTHRNYVQWNYRAHTHENDVGVYENGLLDQIYKRFSIEYPLIIRNAAAEDAGYYTCVEDAGSGRLSISYRLKFEGTVVCHILSSSSLMRLMNHNWSAMKQRLHPQSVAEISCHSVLSGDRIRQCETSSGSRHKDTDQCL